MGDNKIDNGAIVIPQIRNRKRFLEISEDQNEEDNTSRKQNLFSEWQETLRSIGVPSKKGFIGNDSQYNDMIDQGLADNFEDSLSGLGVDITTASYNMSDAMMALPTVGVFKEDPLSPTHKSLSPSADTPTTFDESSQSTADGIFKLLTSDSYTSELPSTPSIHQLLHQHMSFTEAHPSLAHTVQTTANHAHMSPTEESSVEDVGVTESSCYEYKFQYILGAATSVAVRVDEESLTYLNQGQSYEIKVKRLGDITSCQGRLYHSRLRICFHERRMQFMEKHHLAFWKNARPGERILEIDVPLSYGISDVVQDQALLNVCEFDWDPTKEVGVYVKVNCISTEFTPKKHGGEKGVPFKLVIETLSHSNSRIYSDQHQRLHACACQLKVFRLKGADRKHKQDREKMMKRSSGDDGKYQRQCECTILQEVASDSLNSADESPPNANPTPPRVTHVTTPPTKEAMDRVTPPIYFQYSADKQSALKEASSPDLLSADASALDTEMWLVAHRFPNLISVFVNFSGSDLLQLSRSELIEICGLVDGIRLFNTLRPKGIPPLRTLYFRLDSKLPYSAIYLHSLTLSGLTEKMSHLLNISSESIKDVLLEGPLKIRFHVTDEVVVNMKDESAFTLDILQDSTFDKFQVVLRMTSEAS